MTVNDAAIGFFADLLVAEGGLYEERNGLVTCLVPEGLRRHLDLPEAVTVTTDPDVSREDDALLLGPGHPVIDAAADRVLEAADVGVAHVRAPLGPPPSVEALLPRIRDEVVVDHGRIDVAGAPAGVRVPLVRAGALAIYDVTPDDRFHERVEAWVDAATALALPRSLVSAADCSGAGPVLDGPRRILPCDHAAAVAGAHALLEQRAAERLAELGRQRGAQTAGAEEAARAEAYYRAALVSLGNRRASATPERRLLLDAQAEGVRAEQARRLREIDEKFSSRFALRPFRLQVVTLPALSVPLVARRGPRAWPLTLVWLTGPGKVLPFLCPHCSAAAPLVAGKDRLGCRTCLPSASLAPAAPVRVPGAPGPPTHPARPPSPADGSPPSPPAAGRQKRSGPTGPRRAERRHQPPVDVGRMGERLARDLLRTVLAGRRWPRRDLAVGSPLEALVRAYGQGAFCMALDLPDRLALEDVRVVTFPSQRKRAEVTTGVLTVRGMRLPFTLRWHREGSRARPGELLPFAAQSLNQAAARTLPSCRAVALGPAPAQLDPVARELWPAVGSGGLPLLARALAAWWSASQATSASLASTPEEAARDVVEAVRFWMPGNVVVDHLGGPDWWAP